MSTSLRHTLPLSEFYRDYVVEQTPHTPRNYVAQLRGYRIYSVSQNTVWNRLYWVYVHYGSQYMKLQCRGYEPVVVTYVA